MIWVGVLNMFVAFFLYLLIAGAGLQRAFDVILRSALTGLGMGLLMAAFPYYVSSAVGHAYSCTSPSWDASRGWRPSHCGAPASFWLPEAARSRSCA